MISMRRSSIVLLLRITAMSSYPARLLCGPVATVPMKGVGHTIIAERSEAN